MAKLYFYFSAMNAGKSTTLLQSAHNYEERGMTVMMFTPEIDDRENVGVITSRIGLERQAVAFRTGDDLFVHVRDQLDSNPDGIDCIMVDECQFLTARQVLQLSLIVDRLKIPVLCYGLRTDFRGEPFEGSKYLLAWADELNEIKTVCHTGKKATMNARLDQNGNRVISGEQIEIGHNYIALSRSEFELEKVSPIGYEIPESVDSKS